MRRGWQYLMRIIPYIKGTFTPPCMVEREGHACLMLDTTTLSG